jgi:ferredoxin
MRVWIDQSLCTGDGLCTEICPPLFDMHDDGLAYVKEADWPNLYVGSDNGEPTYQGGTGLALVPDHMAQDAIDAAEECPGECIFLTE